MKEISVIVPCYNVEKYIDVCMESLVNQTLGMDQMELILVDDASQDDTLEHLKAWEQEYQEQIMVVECAVNGRQGTARNIGMQYATGKFQRMEREIFNYFPDYSKNKKLMNSGNAMWNLLLEVLSWHCSEGEFQIFMEIYTLSFRIREMGRR